MKKFILMAIFIACSAPFSFAQTTSSDDYHKVEGYGGYSYNSLDTGDVREGFNGFETSVTGNFHRYVGAQFDYSFHRDSFDLTTFGTTLSNKNDLHTVLGGVQIKDNSKETKVKPFANLLVGVANFRSKIDFVGGTAPPAAFVGTENSDTGFAAAIGGGLDLRVNERFDIRAIKVDYNPTRFGNGTLHNVRVGVGIVIH